MLKLFLRMTFEVMKRSGRDIYEESYDEGEEYPGEIDPYEEDQEYFPLEESKPPHY